MSLRFWNSLITRCPFTFSVPRTVTKTFKEIKNFIQTRLPNFVLQRKYGLWLTDFKNLQKIFSEIKLHSFSCDFKIEWSVSSNDYITPHLAKYESAALQWLLFEEMSYEILIVPLRLHREEKIIYWREHCIRSTLNFDKMFPYITQDFPSSYNAWLIFGILKY